MAEYIERNKAMAVRFSYGFNEDGVLYVPWRDVATHLKSLPAADVVEVVRCKDCVIPHNRFTGCPRVGGRIVHESFYCADGRKSW